MKLLMVEDEVKTANFLKRGFEEAGFVVSVAQDGIEAVHLLQAGTFGLVILDILLPGISGWEVLQWLRGAGLQMPVLILTASDAVSEKVRGLELGADDYLVKPFAFASCWREFAPLCAGHPSGSRQPLCTSPIWISTWTRIAPHELDGDSN